LCTNVARRSPRGLECLRQKSVDNPRLPFEFRKIKDLGLDNNNNKVTRNGTYFIIRAAQVERAGCAARRRETFRVFIVLEMRSGQYRKILNAIISYEYLNLISPHGNLAINFRGFDYLSVAIYRSRYLANIYLSEMRLTKFEVCENATTAIDLATDC